MHTSTRTEDAIICNIDSVKVCIHEKTNTVNIIVEHVPRHNAQFFSMLETNLGYRVDFIGENIFIFLKNEIT